MALSEFERFEWKQFAFTVALGFVVCFVVNTIWRWYFLLVALYACMKVLRRGTVAVKGQGVLITGCDTGFGHDLARRLDELGFTVFAGCLYPDGEDAKRLRTSSSKNLHIVPMDVGKDESVQSAHDYVVQNLPESGLWAIVNNAGFNVIGDVEWLTVNMYHKVMSVNFYGAVRTINTFLYLVRKTKGRVINVTSVRGVFSWPCDSAYHSSKHALETMTDSLRLEMQKFGVKVVKIRPGKYGNATGCRRPEHYKRFRDEAEEMWHAASDYVREAYGRAYLDGKVSKSEKHSREDGSITTRPVIEAMVHAITSKRPNTTYLVDGIGNGWIDTHTTLARYHGYLPTCVSDWILTKMTKCDQFPDYCHLKKD